MLLLILLAIPGVDKMLTNALLMWIVTSAVFLLSSAGITDKQPVVIITALMLGIPGQTLAEWEADVDKALALDVGLERLVDGLGGEVLHLLEAGQELLEVGPAFGVELLFHAGGVELELVGGLEHGRKGGRQLHEGARTVAEQGAQGLQALVGQGAVSAVLGQGAGQEILPHA